MNFQPTFGSTIKKLREEKNLPLREVAKALNIDTSMLGKIEKDTRKPSDELILKLSAFYNVSDKDLKIAFLSDTVAYQVLGNEEYAIEAFKVAEKKIKYHKTRGN